MLGTVSRLSTAFGVEVTGIDLEAPLDPAQQTEVRRLLDTHRLLLFRHPDLSAEAHVRLVSSLGTVGLQPNGKVTAHVSNTREDANASLRNGPLTFHSDYAFTTSPIAVLSLYAEEADPEAESTNFADAIRAATLVTPEMRERLRGMSARHVFDPLDIPGARAPGLRDGTLEPSDDAESAVHPVLVRHPRTGEDVLYINYAQTEQLVGMARDESVRLLDSLFAGFYGPDNVYEHHWQPGDLIVWDNVALQHGRGDVGDDKPRSLRRVVIPGSEL